MPPPSTVVADHKGNHAVPAHVAHLVAAPAHHIPESAAPTSSTTASPLGAEHVGLGTLPGNMASNVAEVANRLVGAVASKMARLATVVAGLLVGAVGRHVALLIAVVAEPHVARGHRGRRALLRTVTRLAARVADTLVRAVAGCVPRLLAVPAQGLRGAL